MTRSKRTQVAAMPKHQTSENKYYIHQAGYDWDVSEKSIESQWGKLPPQLRGFIESAPVGYYDALCRHVEFWSKQEDEYTRGKEPLNIFYLLQLLTFSLGISEIK